MIGQTVSHYEVLERIGEGGMGVVYKARDTLLGRLVALKTLPAGGAADPERRARLLREARAASALHHPNIVAVHDLLHHEGNDVIVMELVTGRALNLAVAGTPLREVLGYARQVADALARAHAAGIVHRDLKPSNVMVDEDGTVRILDFGLARLGPPVGTVDLGRESARPTAETTAEGHIVGTLAYMSPEQAEGKKADARSDVFSFGAVVYEMVTGRMAFRGDSAAATLAAVLEHEPPPPRELMPELPPDLQKLIQRCLRKDPAKRHQSMGDVALDLDEIVSGLEAVRGEPGGTPRRRADRFWDDGLPVRARFRWSTGRVALAVGFVTALLALLVGLSLRGLRERPEGEAGPRVIESIAVLPLRNLSGDPEQEYFADGMTEALIADLAKIRSLRVISPTSVMQYKAVKKPLSQIASELGVDAVVEGSVMRSGNRVRITTQLVRAFPEKHLWAESYERDLEDVLTVQGDVARRIVEAVEAAVTPEEEARLASAGAVNPEAHDAYLKGLYFWNEGPHQKAAPYFEEAVQKDPDYAPAYAKLAECHVLDAMRGLRAPDEAYADAETAALRALELDGTLAEAHTALAEISFHRDWDWNLAERRLGRALSAKPSYAIGHWRQSGHLMAVGRFDEAIALSRRAQALDPLTSFSRVGMAMNLYYARRYAEAIAEMQEAIELYPDNPNVHRFLGLSYSEEGMHKEAIAALKQARALGPDDVDLKAALGRAYALGGRTDEARQLLRELRKASESAPSINMVGLLAALGEKGEALDVLERAFEARLGGVVWVKVDPRFDPLRDDPRFRAFVRRLNLRSS